MSLEKMFSFKKYVFLENFFPFFVIKVLSVKCLSRLTAEVIYAVETKAKLFDIVNCMLFYLCFILWLIWSGLPPPFSYLRF
jgi:hypothetical protein